MGLVEILFIITMCILIGALGLNVWKNHTTVKHLKKLEHYTYSNPPMREDEGLYRQPMAGVLNEQIPLGESKVSSISDEDRMTALDISNKIIKQFELDEGMINKLILYYITRYHDTDYFNCLFFIFDQSNNIYSEENVIKRWLPVLKQLQIAEFIIWRSNIQEHIDSVYAEIIAISHDRNAHAYSIRANAIDILKRSNNMKYLGIPKKT